MKRLKEAFNNTMAPYKNFKNLTKKDKMAAIVFAILCLGSIGLFVVGTIISLI